MNPSSIGIGFSHQRVPSLSNVAIRSAGGTNSGPPSVVTRSTKSRIAARVGVSRHEASTSVIAGSGPVSCPEDTAGSLPHQHQFRLSLEVEIGVAADIDRHAVDGAAGE